MKYERASLVAFIFVVACTGDEPAPAPDTGASATCRVTEVRTVVERFGSRLQQVQLLAPQAQVEAQLREHYGDLVTQQLLEQWIAAPGSAPGRDVSSPWPARIVVDSITIAADGSCRAHGAVVYATSTDSAATHAPVTVSVMPDDRSRISAVTFDARDNAVAAPDDAAAAVETLRRYYGAIDAKRYRDAYALWSDDGTGSGQTFDEFAAGYAETSRVTFEPGTPGRIGPAAGSRYIDIPVEITATTDKGVTQRFIGSYVLRRSVVDGATAAQRSWRIYSASIVHLDVSS